MLREKLHGNQSLKDPLEPATDLDEIPPKVVHQFPEVFTELDFLVSEIEVLYFLCST